MDRKMMAGELVKVAELLLGGRKASLDLEMASLEEVEKIANFLAGGLSHRDAAIASYCLNSVVDGEYGGLVWNLYKKAVAKYKDGMLAWFSEALLDRANVVNFGGLNGALTEFVKAIPSAALRGDSPKVPPFRKDWGFLNADRLTAAGRKVVSVLITDAKAAGLWKDATSGSGLGAGQELQKNDATGVFFLPYSDWTKANQNLLRGMGFKPDWISAKWFLGRMTPEVEGFFSKEPVQAVRPSPEEFSGWYFKSWLPKNVSRFNNLFEKYVRDAGSTITFAFGMTDRGDVKVEMTRGVTRLSQAVEELRLRYLGRNGREPWLEVMSEVLKLRKSSDNPTEVMGIIDRMNNLEHSNGMFMERFPASVKSWYLKFLNAKYHAPTAFELAKYVGDSDLEELLKFVSGERRHPETQFPEYENMEKQAPEREIGPEVNWLALGYPYQHGKKRPEVDDPEVQEGLESLRSMGASRRDRM